MYLHEDEREIAAYWEERQDEEARMLTMARASSKPPAVLPVWLMLAKVQNLFGSPEPLRKLPPRPSKRPYALR